MTARSRWAARAAIVAAMFATGLASGSFAVPVHVHAQADTGDWIYLGLVADAGGVPEKWLGDTGFEFADVANKNVVPKNGDRIRLTTVKQIRRTNAQGKPYERAPVQNDTVGEFGPGTVLRVVEIGRRPTSKAGDRWQCWARVEH